MNESTIREQMVATGESLFNRGLTAGSSGNLSVRLDAGWAHHTYERLTGVSIQRDIQTWPQRGASVGRSALEGILPASCDV